MINLFNCVQIITLPSHVTVLYLDTKDHLKDTSSSKLKHINQDQTTPSFSHELLLLSISVCLPHTLSFNWESKFSTYPHIPLHWPSSISLTNNRTYPHHKFIILSNSITMPKNLYKGIAHLESSKSWQLTIPSKFPYQTSFIPSIPQYQYQLSISS